MNIVLSPGSARYPRIMCSRLQAVVVLASFLLLFLLTGGCREKTDTEPAVRPVAVRVVKPVVADMENRLTYMGTIHSVQEIRVMAQIQGTVTDMPFKEGEQINKGDAVVRLNAPELSAAVERQRVEVDYWCRRHASDQRLVTAKSLPEEQMEASGRACGSAGAALKEAESRLAKTVEISPINGEVLKRYVEPGQSVMPGQQMMLLGDDRMEIRTEVVEEDLRRGVVVGMAAQIADGRGNRFFTSISEVAPMASGTARAFLVRLPVETVYAADLRKGASVRVQFILASSRETVTVPLNAVADREGTPHIFLIRDQTAFHLPVTLGIAHQGWIEADFSWNGRDLVAVSSLGDLHDNSPVFPVLVEGTR